ncbi:hypothetical protein BaRGS_00019149, partial [Batillaria attramentaria]
LGKPNRSALFDYLAVVMTTDASTACGQVLEEPTDGKVVRVAPSSHCLASILTGNS